MSIMTDQEFQELLAANDLPATPVYVFRADVTRAAEMLHAVEHDDLDQMLKDAAQCAALALAWHQRVLRAHAGREG